jgi:hypothetical protein
VTVPRANRRPFPAPASRRRTPGIARLLAAGTLLASIGSAPADEAAVTGTAPLDGLATAPRVAMIRAEQPPKVDGRLDDAAWSTATVIDDFRQVEPVEGGEPSERTVLRLLYDEDFLYVGVRCYDREPDQINASVMLRDANFGSDDRISIVVDTFFDRRNAYLFEMNPTGAKGDALVENNTRIRREWDGIWYGKATIDDEGWTAEMAIPFKTISFRPGGTRWGFNASRVVRRRNETIRWSAVSQNKSLSSIGDAGVIEELTGMQQGAGIDIKPYGLLKWTHEPGDDDSVEADAGVDIFYKLSPSTTLTVTVNTDFAETEVDERRVNLTRFPLFFPEKRDFFLQDAGIFDFGGIRRNPLPFQSRRIGIGPDGQARDILAGVKLTGREGPWNFGMLNVQMQEDNKLGWKNYTVGRAALNVLEESEVGVLVTAGDPGRRGDNYVAGGDFNYRTSTYDGDKVVESNMWFLQSWTKNSDVDQTESAVGFKLRYPNDRIRWGVGFSQIGDDFDAALGFVPRPGIREWFGDWRYRWRPQGTGIRRIDSGLRGTLITDLDDEVESQDIDLELFEIVGGVVIPVDCYRFERYGAAFSTSSSRPVSFEIRFSGGDFYTGTRYEISTEAELRLAPHLFVGMEYEMNDVDLDEGSFITRVWRVRLNVYFTPDVSWTNFVQYDNFTETVGVNSRLRWIVQPGSELFLVVNQAFSVADSELKSNFTELTTKINWTFRF